MATMQNHTKYRPGYYPPPQEKFEWINRDHVTEAPRWCSVDLRDGNQALIEPMTLQEKLDMSVTWKNKSAWPSSVKSVVLELLFMTVPEGDGILL